MDKFSKVSRYYKLGLWGVGRLKDAVRAGWITRNQFEQLMSADYSEV